MKKCLLAAAVLLMAAAAAGQPAFDGIKSRGPIPNDLKLSLDDLYALDKQRVRDFNDGKLTNRDKVLQSSYFIYRLMANGRILYGDPITAMLNRVADTLMKNYPELRRELRIYTVKSPEVNAFATGQGMIFVTTGLVAQIEDEAQLAFIIGHEAIHYYRQHTIQEITRKEEKASGSEAERERREMSDFLKYHNRSHQMENESDSLGLAMFYIDSPYDKGVTDGVFDVLQYGYLPFDEVPVDSATFNTPYYAFPGKYFLGQVAPITARDDFDDSKSNHPNILKRRQRCASVLAGLSGGSRFVTVSEQEFGRLRDLARKECIRQDLIYAEYTRALYDIMVMQQSAPEDEFLLKAKAKALYGMSKFKTYTNTNKVVGDYTNFEGEVQQAYHFFSKISNEELNLLAVRELWKAKRRFPADSLIAAMAEDAAKDLGRKHGYTAASFSDRLDTAQASDDTNRTASKYDKIKKKKKRSAQLDMRRYFFTDLEGQPELQAFLADCFAKAKDTAARRAVAAGRKNMFVYASEYYVLGKDELKIRKSNRLEQQLTGMIGDVARREGRGIVDFSDRGLRCHDDEQSYNDFVDLHEWVNEMWQTKGDFQHVLVMQPAMSTLVRRYDADRVNLTTVVNLEGVSDGASAIFAIFLPPVWPVIGYQLFAGTERTLLRTLYVDAADGNIINVTTASLNLADSRSRVKGLLCDNIEFAEGREQSPFMGRRLLVEADLAATPNQGAFVVAKERSVVGFAYGKGRAAVAQFVPKVALQVQVARRHAVRAGFDVRQTYLRAEASDFNSPIIVFTKVNVFALPVTVFNSSLGYRQYREPAPMGLYWGADLTWAHTALAPEQLTRFPDGECPKSYNAFGLRFEFGRNYIFYDRLLLNIGMTLGATFASPMSKTSDQSSQYSAGAVAKANRSYFNTNVWIQNCYGLKIGLGFLPF